jgi:hypothetical protein
MNLEQLFEWVLREADENNSGLPRLVDHIDSILQVISSNDSEQKRKYEGQFFFLANNTSQELKDLGVTGEFFNVKYGVISRHYKKDKYHCLTVQDWKDLCDTINHPFAIVPYLKGFRFYMRIQKNGKPMIVGINVENVARNLEINNITTTFFSDRIIDFSKIPNIKFL